MAQEEIIVQSLDEAFALFQKFAADPAETDAIVRIAPGVAVHQVYVPHPPVNSSISPPIMEAFLVLQRELYQLAALAKTGVANSNKLDEIDRQDLEIVVQVSGGSSNIATDVAGPVSKVLNKMLGKMTGRQINILILGMALIGAGTWSFRSWLEAQKSVQIEELRSRPLIEAIKALTFATEQQAANYKQVVDVLNSSGKVGERIVEASDAANAAFLKAASKTPVSVMNGATLSSDEAGMLRHNPRSKAEKHFSTEIMRVVEINTNLDVIDTIVLMRPETREQFATKLGETLFASEDREALFQALHDRTEIEVELMFREVDGEVKGVEFLRVTRPR
jgi:hypothetical protein